MKRKLAYALCIIICLIACIVPFLRVDKKVPFEEMKKTATTLVNEKDFKLEDKKFIRKQYELDDSAYLNILCYGTTSAMEVNEFTMVECKNEQQRTSVMKQLKKRIDKQYKSFSGYAPRQADLLKKAQLYEKGDYVILIVYKDSVEIQNTLHQLF